MIPTKEPFSTEKASPKKCEETACPQQCVCADFVPTLSGKTCIHYELDDFGNDLCHSQYDEEEWELEEDCE